jgi:Tfp pilus assembly protein PilN
MSTPLHLDLLKEDERLSSSPIRLRVMMPMTASFVALCLLVWWSLICLRSLGQVHLKMEVEQAIHALAPVHASVLDARAQEQEIKAVIGQLSLYKNSCNRFGESFSKLTASIPETIQFTELRIAPPQPVASPDPAHPVVPTNLLEQVTLRISGRTGGERPSEGVNALLATLRTPAFTNLFRTAFIPKGAFRQDTVRNPDNRETLLFEITCECLPRRFE